MCLDPATLRGASGKWQGGLHCRAAQASVEAMSEFTDIPVLDLTPLLEGDLHGTDALARSFLRAYGETGFAYITGHGVKTALVEQVFDASRRFHALPHGQKMRIAVDRNHRGFIAMGTSTDVNSTLAEVTKPNRSESFMMMREEPADAATHDFLSGPNQWPAMEGFREVLEAYNARMCHLAHRLVGLAAQSLGARGADLWQHFEPPTTWLRLLYYPPTDPAEADLYGSAPHTDFGALTILAQDPVGGLQVQTPAGEWVDAPPRGGAFVVNVGDMLNLWSNGRLRSTPHRVINASGRARYSVPFFYDPSVRATAAPLPCCMGPRDEAAKTPVQFGAFLRHELGAAYDAHKGEEK